MVGFARVFRINLYISTTYLLALGLNINVVASPGGPKEAEIPVVFALSVEETPLFDVLSYPARVNPQVVARVLAESDGVVTKVLTPLGQGVKRNQRLVEIRNTDPVYQFAAAFSRAPIQGVVSELAVREGTNVTKNQDLLTITNPDEVRINVEVAASDLSSIHSGSKGELTLNGQSVAVPVRVEGVSPFVNPSSGTATCELVVDGKKPAFLRPGLIGQVTFKTNARTGITIPDHAVFYRDGETYLRTIADGEVTKLVKVELGPKQRGKVEVLKGVSAGTRIIERTNRFVGDGQKVKVEAAKTSETSTS